jgi:glycoside/pentoside/hexuronide:cation symporter, GPH family
VFTGALLTNYGFIADKAQSLAVNHVLIALMSVIPAAFGLISVILIFFYRLDEKTMKDIQADLESRRREVGNSPLPA